MPAFITKMRVATIDVGSRVRLAIRGWDEVPPPVGRPFLLVHGLASNARLWDGVAGGLAAMGHPTVAVDLRGHGQSSKPDEGYDFGSMAGDLRALVRAVGLRQPVLVGQSWGADVVVETAGRFPTLVAGVVCVDGGISDLGARFPDWDECARRLAPPPLAGTPAGAIEAGIRARHPEWSDLAIQGTLANFEVRPDGTVAPWLTFERHMRILRALWEHRPIDAWSRVGAPALVCPAAGGDAAWYAAKRRALGRVQAVHRATRVHWFPGDHDVHAEHPDELAALLHAAVVDGFFP
jgi:pimeloyl-ACP methyl ester carboxylesterase